MQFSLENLAALATILGTLFSVIALIESRSWLILTSFSLVAVALISGLYARRERLAIDAAGITIEGRSIDSLNVANLRRDVNRTLFVQEAHHTARIDGEDISFVWTYAGFCRAKQESAMQFSIATEQQLPFETLDCEAYDLAHDPGRHHRIQPLLVGADGVSKKISVPFLEPVKKQQRFGVMLKCMLPRATKSGFGYYSSTLSFAQETVTTCTVRLLFIGTAPAWVRVYDCSSPGRPALLKTLAPVNAADSEYEYVDVVKNGPGRSARVYAYWRDAV
jgi:hypothetical protein